MPAVYETLHPEEMTDSTEYEKINEAIVQCLGPALPKLRRLGPEANREELKQTISGSFGGDIAAKVMDLYEAGTSMPVDWRCSTDESVRADLTSLYDGKAPGLTEEAKKILVECSSAFGW